MENLQGKIPGNATLEQQENTLNRTEKIGSIELSDYQITEQTGAPEHENTATFKIRNQDAEDLPLLKLAEIPDNKKESEIKAKFPDKKKLFTTDVWVADVVKKVLVLR